MYPSIKNLIFEGGGVLGVSYLGAVDYLDEIGILPQIEKVAGSSAGAITACLLSFNTSFNELKIIASSLDYKKIPQKEKTELRDINDDIKKEFEKLFDDINCVHRLINNYGWYSTKYFYNWIKEVIANQFDKKKKQPPYTFEDFENEELHLNNKIFKDLYIIGTDISFKTSVVFSYATTPKMEVAEAVRISMSVPLYFEAVKINNKTNNYIYADGSLMRNYPINLFDYNGINYETLGMQFKNKTKYTETKNTIDYISNVFNTLLKVQEDIYNNDKLNQGRTININTGGISALDFNISNSDYKFLYKQGYEAALDYFEDKFH
ncbi:MAG: patatin-like phospholipase family protein [Bacilli bacterium]|nr:patatin-like phospholipase family protein [Bacilli bacterium]MDD4053579.1 patatin-like phospholipase family protein [Bacilli bacterium]MDD4411454.1 patatin-like phospholipase family protein [Bacilli bacterium]